MLRIGGCLLAAGLLLAACAATPPQSGMAHDTAWALADGGNGIEGKALLRMPDGTTYSCAAYTVTAAPASPYAEARMQALYGSTTQGHRAAEAPRAVLPVDEPAYYRNLRTASCDTQGRFAFAGLPDGSWYVVAPVIWQKKLGEPFEGASFMKHVAVKGGHVVHITMGYAGE